MITLKYIINLIIKKKIVEPKLNLNNIYIIYGLFQLQLLNLYKMERIKILIYKIVLVFRLSLTKERNYIKISIKIIKNGLNCTK